MYVIADEQDAIKLRSNYRKDLVYLYPAKASKEGTKKLFLDMVKKVNTLKDYPEFYNTITNNCTTNIIKHIDNISPESVRLFYLQGIFPKYSDKLAYELNLLDTKLTFEEARIRYLINDKATIVFLFSICFIDPFY